MGKKTYVITVSKKFMAKHSKAGQPTNFKEKILAGKKIHTIRGNIQYWSTIVHKVNAGEALLSVREWSGKPYASKQVEICQFHKLGIQVISHKDGVRTIDGAENWVDINLIAENDGLDFFDMYEWFKGKIEGAIIHFTDFRYKQV